MRGHLGGRDACGMKRKSAKKPVRNTGALWEQWRFAADEVWEAWAAVVASNDNRDEPHRWYLEALVYEELAADRLALALGR
jgi:hypothetical protein